MRLGGGWLGPHKEIRDLPGTSAQAAETSPPGFYDSKRPQRRWGWESHHGGQRRGSLHIWGAGNEPQRAGGAGCWRPGRSLAEPLSGERQQARADLRPSPVGTSDPLWLKRAPSSSSVPLKAHCQCGARRSVAGLPIKCPDGRQPLRKLISLNLPSTAGQLDAHRKRREELGYKERANLRSQRGHLG